MVKEIRIDFSEKQLKCAEFVRDAVVKAVSSRLYDTAHAVGDCGLSADDMEFLSDMLEYAMEQVAVKKKALANVDRR